MPSVTHCLNSFFRKVDLFPSTSLLRYNGDKEYTTATGGIISIVIITIFIILFFNMGVKTVKK